MDATLGKLTVDIMGNLGPLRSSLGSANATLRGFAGLASAATKALGFGMVAGTGLAIKAAIDLESSYSQLRKTTGMTGDELEQMKGRLQGLGSTMAGVSVGDINDIAIMAGRLGITGVDAIGTFTESIARIKVALDDIPAEESATAIAKMLNQFGLGVGDVERFGSALNKLDDSSTASGREILDVTRRLSGAAATMKMSAAETLALGTTIIDAGINAEVGGTAVSKLIGKMATEPKKFAAITGQSMEEFAATFRGSPIKALQAFGAAMGKLAPAERLAALKSLKFTGGQTGMPLLQLVNILPRLGVNLATANAEWSSMSSLQMEVAEKANTTEAQLQLLANNAQYAAAAFGTHFLPSLRAVAAAVPGIQSAFADLAATPFAEQFTANVTGGFSTMAEGVGAALATVTAAIRNWDMILEDSGLRITQALFDVGTVFSWLRDTAGAFLDWFGANWKTIITDAVAVAVSQFIVMAHNIGAAFQAVMSILSGGSIEGAMADLKSVFKDPREAFNQIVKTEAPDLPDLKFKDVTGERRLQLREEMDAREVEAQDRAAAAKADKAKSDQKIKAQPGDEATGKFDDGGKDKDKGQKQSVFMALADLSKSMNEAALGKGDHAKKTADNTGRMVALQEQMLQAQKAGGVPAVAVGPA